MRIGGMAQIDFGSKEGIRQASKKVSADLCLFFRRPAEGCSRSGGLAFAAGNGLIAI